MSTHNQDRLSVSSLALLAVAFIVAVIVSNQMFKGVRLDLTENRLYTLSDGTERILASIDEPIDLYFYFSDEATSGVPSLREYANRVREMLEEFEDTSRGKIRLSVVDPLPFSEDEDRAAQFGLQGIQLSVLPDPVYMGLAGTNSVGDEEVIEFFQPDKEAFLEYDIAKLVSTLANPERTIVGLVSGISMSGEFDPQTQRMQPPWVVYQQAQQLFEIRDLGTAFDAVPEDVSLLWIVQPRNVSATTQYAIDQFVMRGGKALIFVDPVAGVDPAAAEDMPQGMGMPAVGQGSDLPLLFGGWGIEFTAQQVVADAQLALQLGNPMGGAPVRHYGYLGITADGMNADDVTTAELSTINLALAGEVRLADESEASLEPLLTSSPRSMLLPSSRFAFLPDPQSLQDGFSPGGSALAVAARIGGTLPSAFPDGPPQAAAEDESEDEEPEHLGESSQSVNLIVVTDVDMLSDSLWVQVQRFFGQQVASAFASNGAFVANALESLAGNSNLISVRSRGSFARPFSRVDELRVRAEAQYRETEQRLQQELADAERRLGELQASREDSGSLLLTPEQQGELDRFIDQRSSIRKELRAVQRGLDEDIKSLGTALKAINIGLVPLLLTVSVLLVLWRRRREEQS
jgi:ABC-type uncharacterized transport system involved in gliding motility auxiliary subunit